MLSDEQIDEFIKQVEQEIVEANQKINAVDNIIENSNMDRDPHIMEEAKKLMKEEENSFEANQRVALMRDSFNSVATPARTSSARMRRRGLSI